MDLIHFIGAKIYELYLVNSDKVLLDFLIRAKVLENKEFVFANKLMSASILNLPEENSCGCVDLESGKSTECMCTATGLVQIIGRKYSMRLLTVIGEHVRIRFNDLQDAMDDMSSSTLTIRLAELESAGLIERKTYHEAPPRVEYKLTKEGRELQQNLFSFSKYASRK